MKEMNSKCHAGGPEGTNRKIILILCLVFIVLGIIYTYPLISYFNKGMPYSYLPAPGHEVTSLVQGDYLQLYYKLWLFKDAVTGGTAFFSDPYQFSIDDAKGDFSTQFLPMSLPFLVFSVFGDTFAYNSMMIFSFLLSGLGTYLLVHFYTRDKCSAIFGAIIFTLAPFRTAHLLAGHPGGFLVCLLPLSVYFLEMGFSRKSYKYGVFSGLCILSLALIELHLTYYIFLFMTVFILFRSFLPSGKENGWWKGLMPVLFLIFLSVVSVLLLRNEKLAASTISSGREWTEIRLFSPAIGDILRRNNKTIEKYIYPGIVPLLLVIACFCSGILTKKAGTHPAEKPGRRSAGYGETAAKIFYGIVLLASLVLALGPSLDNIFPVYRLCHKYVPYYNFSRTPGRIMVLAFLSISILAGFGAKWIKEGKGKRRTKHAILAVFMLGILIDYHPMKQVGISLIPGSNKVYKTIEDNIGSKRLLELPIWPGDSSWSAIYLYNATRTRARLINGYSSTTPRGYVQNIFFPLYNLDFGEMRENQYNLLKDLNVKYVTLHEDAFPYKVSPYPYNFSLRNLKGSKYLKSVAHDHPVWLFELLPAPSGTPPDSFNQSSVIGTLYEAERLPRRTGSPVKDSQASGESAVFGKANREEEGHLLFGPYRTFPTGRYNAIFRLKAGDITNKVKAPEALRIDISTDKGQTILAEKILRGTDFSSPNRYQDFVLPIDLDKPQRLEFRVYHYGNISSWADYVYILFRNEKDPESLYEAEELFHIGRVEPDEPASGGEALFAEIGREPRDYLISGPNRRYPKGKYQTSFYLKTQDSTPSDIARIEVSSSRRKKIIASRIINGTDFRDKNAYQRFTLSFELHKPEILEFLVFFTGKSNIAVDKVDVFHDNF